MTSAEYRQWATECDAREAAGGVMPGWTAEHWMDELRRKIAVCGNAENRQAMVAWLEKLEMRTRLTLETTDEERKSGRAEEPLDVL